MLKYEPLIYLLMFQPVNFLRFAGSFSRLCNFQRLQNLRISPRLNIELQYDKNRRSDRMKRRESEEKSIKDSGEREAQRSTLISRVCKLVIINNDCRCVKWMFMNAILMKRECEGNEETAEGLTNVVIRRGRGG